MELDYSRSNTILWGQNIAYRHICVNKENGIWSFLKLLSLLVSHFVFIINTCLLHTKLPILMAEAVPLETKVEYLPNWRLTSNKTNVFQIAKPCTWWVKRIVFVCNKYTCNWQSRFHSHHSADEPELLQVIQFNNSYLDFKNSLSKWCRHISYVIFQNSHVSMTRYSSQ